MRWRCGSYLILPLLFLLCPSSYGYERDVHFDLTKYLALWAGFSESDAEQVATADQELDTKPEFNPMPNPNFCPALRKVAGAASALVAIPVACKDDPEFQRMLTAQRAYHFVDGKRLQELRESAFRGKNLKILGHYLHALQDAFAHSLMDYKDLPPTDKLVASLGFPPDEKVIGHLLYGHSVDKTYERPDLAEFMAKYVYKELTEFQGSANRWNDVEATVARFVREKDLQRQVRYLSASSPSLPPDASSQPSGLPTKPQEPMYEGRTLVEWQADVRNPSPAVREKATEALGHFGDKAVPILVQTLKDTNADVRWAAAHALGEIGPAAKDAVPALVQALKDPDDMVRGRAEVTLRRIDPSVLENWEQTQKAAAEEEARRRREAENRTQQARIREVEALNRSGQKALPGLIQALGDKDAEVQRKAAEALGEIGAGARDAVPALTKAARSSNSEVQLAARKALRRIKFPSSPPGPCRGELSNRLGGVLASTRYIRPCPVEGDEEEKAAADQLAAAFKAKYGIQQMVDFDSLCRNPFTFEGKTIGMKATYERMSSSDVAILMGRALQRDSFSSEYEYEVRGCPLIVSKIRPGMFGTDTQELVLAATVLGRTSQGDPHLKFVGAHMCKRRDCADFFGPESMR